MTNFIVYTIECTLCFAFFYAIYWLFLKKETFFKAIRFYLLFTAVLAVCLPALKIKNLFATDSFVSTHVIVPVREMEEEMLLGLYPFSNQARDYKYNNQKFNSIPSTSDEQKAETATSAINYEATTWKANQDKLSSLNWIQLAALLYLGVMCLLALRFLVNLILLFSYVRRNKAERIAGVKLVRLRKNTSPFSFLNFIFIGDTATDDDELNKIISHEKIHIRQAHTFDLLLFELLLITQWLNPFIWLYKKAIRINHEFLADEGTLHAGVNAEDYQVSLLRQSLRRNNIIIASNYNISLKKRITMMSRKRSSRSSLLKLTIAIPVAFVLLTAFSFRQGSQDKAENVFTNAVKYMQNDTTIKRIKVTDEYLKSLEGDYLSVSGPGRQRMITFTAVLGNLAGNDAGYSYRLIPVDEGKFINPDDHAVLQFDTKDKNNITLMLFGLIKLKKLEPGHNIKGFPKKSIAFETANLMADKGIDAALANYKTIKDQPNYELSEGEINLLGYEFLNRGKTNEAVAILEINVDAYPQSFNVYDSYAEALLANGDKKASMANYIKSVKLNPGNKAGIKQLQKMGVNTDTIVKIYKMTESQLNLLTGNYISTNQNDWVRWINFTVVDGVLKGNDNGYRYGLIPLAENKFVNPDDGAILEFNTKNKSDITLNLFGTINLKKVSPSAQAQTKLKKFAGTYVPGPNEKNLSAMDIIFENGKLYRYIKDAEPVNRNIELVQLTDNQFFYIDNSRRSIEFIINDKLEVNSCLLKRADGIFTLSKQK